MATHPTAEKRPNRHLAFSISAAVIGLIGLIVFLGGAWLISLGGSFYYLLCGAGIIATSALLFNRDRRALWLYAFIILATVIWAIAEIGFDWWQLAPRGDVIFLIGLYLCLPFMIRPLIAKEKGERRRIAAAPLLGSLAIAAVVGIFALFSNYHELDGTLASVASAAALQDAADQPDEDWRAYGRTQFGQRYSPLAEITPANAKNLKIAWIFRTGDMKTDKDPGEETFEVTPIKVRDTVYLCSQHQRLFAVDAKTGKLHWSYDPKLQDNPTFQHLTCRGVSYHEAAPIAADATAAPAPSDCSRRI